jgi:hypothetical protein
MAVSASGQTAGLQETANDFWDGGPYRTTSGPVSGTNYGVDAVWTGSAWDGIEWGSGNGTQQNTNIGTNMTTMGILVDIPQGMMITLDHRFYELHPGVVHGEPSEVFTATFGGEIGTNFPILFGLNAADGSSSTPIQFNDTTNIRVKEIRGTLNETNGTQTQTWDNSTGFHDVNFTHNWCNGTYTFEVDVEIDTHAPEGTTILPFYLCPDPTL